MTPTRRGSVPPILRGVSLLARGHAQGLNCFRDTPRAFLASLAPGVGLLLAATIEGIAGGDGSGALTDIPATLCVLLAPAVLSYEMARFWGREAFWYRYIVAFNWCQWLLPAIGFVLLLVVAAAHLAGLDEQSAAMVLLVCFAGYALWLNWFLARHGLALTGWRAAGLVLVVNLGTMLLAFGPGLLGSSAP